MLGFLAYRSSPELRVSYVQRRDLKIAFFVAEVSPSGQDNVRQCHADEICVTNIYCTCNKPVQIYACTLSILPSKQPEHRLFNNPAHPLTSLPLGYRVHRFRLNFFSVLSETFSLTFSLFRTKPKIIGASVIFATPPPPHQPNISLMSSCVGN
jgi:hypothetical protein